jgi:hypothetical protein
MSKAYFATVLLLCAAPMTGWAQQGETVVQVNGTFLPAGTLLGCTLDEPDFSSRTARPGDPVLCRTTSVEMFGRQVIPRGAYLSARLRNYRDPGHFVGKGWIQLEFTSLTLPGGSYPLNAKVISAGRYRVNGDGQIQGLGHAGRDAVEWAIPILWPMKVLTLPARGPRPRFKGETRLELRLMEDMVLPDSASSSFGRLSPRSSASQPGMRLPAAGLTVRQQAPSDARYRMTSAGQRRLTLLVLRGGRSYLVADYWVDNGNLEYTTDGRTRQRLRLDALDLLMTKQLNEERGVAFMLTARTW